MSIEDETNNPHDYDLNDLKPAADLASAPLKPGIADYIAGEHKDFVANLKPYLPQDLIGGVVPYIPGTEEEAVWNAASQACGTEKVHFCYKIEGKQIWYLACPSQSLASHPDSWCPLAAALPGNSEFWDKETVYLYEQEGSAAALRWDPDTNRMQIFLGAARTILPRVQSMDANFTTINAEMAQPIPWISRHLKTEKMSRAMGRFLLLSGIFVTILSVAILFLNFALINTIERDFATIRKTTKETSLELMKQAYSATQNDTIKHMVRVQNILMELTEAEGTLVKYEVINGKTNWEALVSPAFAVQFGKPLGTADDGRVRVKGEKY